MRPPKRYAATISPRIQLGSSHCNHSWSFRINGAKAIVRNSTDTQISSNEQRNRYAALRLSRLRAFFYAKNQPKELAGDHTYPRKTRQQKESRRHKKFVNSLKTKALQAWIKRKKLQIELQTENLKPHNAKNRLPTVSLDPAGSP